MQELSTLEKINNLDQLVHELMKAFNIGMEETPEVVDTLCDVTDGAVTSDVVVAGIKNTFGYMIQSIDEIRKDYIALRDSH